jgi:hypothetical protein
LHRTHTVLAYGARECGEVTKENARKVIRLFPFVNVVPFVFRPFPVNYGRARTIKETWKKTYRSMDKERLPDP